jgi:hypothetical protein
MELTHMSPTAAPPAGTTLKPESGQKQSPVEYVRGLPPEEKQAVFLTLLREALQFNGDTGLMPVEDEHGKPFGYYVPPKASEQQFRSLAPVLTPAQRDTTLRALSTLGNTFDMQSYLDDLKREDGSQG